MASPATPVARSAISLGGPTAVVSGWEVSTRSSSAPLTISDQTPLAKVAVKGDASGPPPSGVSAAHRSALRRADGILEVGSGPGEWLLLGPAGTQADLVAATTEAVAGGPTRADVVDLTHGRALVRLTGPQAKDLLAKVCAIDLHDSVTPNGAAFRTSVAKVVADVVRDDDPHGATPSYLLHVDRSYGQYFFDALLDAGQEFGIEATGFTA